MSQLDDNLERLRRKVDARIEELLILRAPAELPHELDRSAFVTPALALPTMPEPLVLAGVGKELEQAMLAEVSVNLDALKRQPPLNVFSRQHTSATGSELWELATESLGDVAVTEVKEDGSTGLILPNPRIQSTTLLPMESDALPSVVAPAIILAETTQSAIDDRNSASLAAPRPIGFFAKILSRLGLR